MATLQQRMLYLFERPGEPVFLPKGNGAVIYEVPKSMRADRFQNLENDLVTRFGEGEEQVIKVKEVTVPDLSIPAQVGRDEIFTLFNPRHRRSADRLIRILMGMRNEDDLLSAACFCRDRLNPQLFNYCLSVSLLHRPDTHGIQIPPLAESFPDHFLESSVFPRALEVARVTETARRDPIEMPINRTAAEVEPEQRVAYFREDIGINLHHWHWHLVYPFMGPENVVNKDRRGELFYYMHQQILARYNTARMCNNLRRTEPLRDFSSPVPEAYFPKLDNLRASRTWPSRPNNMILRNINRPNDMLTFTINDLNQWRERILTSIRQGALTDKSGKQVKLTEENGIDLIGNLVEASPVLSLNIDFYGDFHNNGHVALAFVHDPDYRYLEEGSVMGATETAMRDPIFYRWHTMINDIFKEHKNLLSRYSADQMDFPGVRVNSVEITNSAGRRNTLATFWQQSDIDLSFGVDFMRDGPVLVRYTHLQHENFVYNITVENSSGIELRGTVRIFLAPKNNEEGRPLSFNEQRELMMEMDKFVVTLPANQRATTVTRRSENSSVTIAFGKTFRDLSTQPATAEEVDKFNFCGCGWPHHMLVPKGTSKGYPCELFVMVSNWQNDKAEEGSTLDGSDADAASFCGLRNKKYPDRKSMGYPFDRLGRDGVRNLREFLTPNMAVQDVTIQFTDRVVAPPQGLRPRGAFS